MARAVRFSTPEGSRDRLRLLNTLGRYTRFVNVSKTLLVLMTLLLLGTVVVVPLLRDKKEGVRIAFSATETAADNELPVMKKPRFQGIDDRDQPYMVTAESAIQKDKDTIQLSKVSADMTFRDETWMLISADEGSLSLPHKELWLTGNVTLFHDGGYEMTTERVRIDLAKSEAVGDRPLSGRGGIGQISAGSFAAFDRGKHLVFDAPVKLIIIPGKANE